MIINKKISMSKLTIYKEIHASLDIWHVAWRNYLITQSKLNYANCVGRCISSLFTKVE